MQSFKMIFSGVTILQGVEFPIFPIDFAWALQQCSATALPVISLSAVSKLCSLLICCCMSLCQNRTSDTQCVNPVPISTGSSKATLIPVGNSDSYAYVLHTKRHLHLFIYLLCNSYQGTRKMKRKQMQKKTQRTHRPKKACKKYKKTTSLISLNTLKSKLSCCVLSHIH